MNVLPPVDMRAPTGAYTVFYILFAVNLVAVVGWLGWQARRRRTAAPLAALAGGLAIGLFLPSIFNSLTYVWFPSNIPFPLVTAFGMHDPWFDPLGYALFIGFGGWLLCSQLRTGRGSRAIYEAFALWGVADLVLELPFLHWGLYTYYGDQPLPIAGFPLHWVFLNGLVPVLSGVLMYTVIERWPCAGPVLVVRVAVCPAVAGALLMVPIAPVATALHADVASGVRVAAAILSIGICAATLRWLAHQFSPDRRPAGSASTADQGTSDQSTADQTGFAARP